MITDRNCTERPDSRGNSRGRHWQNILRAVLARLHAFLWARGAVQALFGSFSYKSRSNPFQPTQMAQCYLPNPDLSFKRSADNNQTHYTLQGFINMTNVRLNGALCPLTLQFLIENSVLRYISVTPPILTRYALPKSWTGGFSSIPLEATTSNATTSNATTSISYSAPMCSRDYV